MEYNVGQFLKVDEVIYEIVGKSSLEIIQTTVLGLSIGFLKDLDLVSGG